MDWVTTTSVFGVAGPFLVVILIFFTLRSNIVRILRDNYAAKEEELKIAVEERDNQRELKHQALTEIATLRGQLLLSENRSDLTPIVTELAQHRFILEQVVTILKLIEKNGN